MAQPLAAGATIDVPPSGAMCGIYARTDMERGVWKAPANVNVNGVVGLEREIKTAEQSELNSLGINCIRRFDGRGIVVWGGRTLLDDPEWRYVSQRRYFLYLEKSIERGTESAVFEPNGEALWASIRERVREFLDREWRSGALQGNKPENAFFVRCDHSTMTQADIDQGRLVCEIGVAPVRPAEFVIFRIGQWTADRQD